MRHCKLSSAATALIGIAALLGFSASPAKAGLVFGPDARTQFENLQSTFGGEFIDFESLPTGTNLTSQLSAQGVSFASNISTSGTPFGPFHVEVSGAIFGSFGNTIVGSPCGGCSDDGRVGYELVFSAPQRWAGLLRIWNTSTLIQFFNSEGGLLDEHANSVNTEFVGYTADGADPVTDWVSRIQIDTISPNNSRQVGYSDDLFFGTVIPEPASLFLLALGGIALVSRRRQ